MKRIFFVVALAALLPGMAAGQLKRQSFPVDIRSGLLKAENGKYLGLFDPSKFHMSHSYSLSYTSMGDMAVGQSLYLNTISYQIANPLSLKMQWGIQSFPYTSFGGDNPAFKTNFMLSGLQLKYQPSDKFMMKLEYNALPMNSYNRYSRFGYYRSSMFLDDDE
jgi:hypothetical protein